MLKLRINPIVVKDLKNIRDWDQIFPNESAFEQIINMRYGKIM